MKTFDDYEKFVKSLTFDYNQFLKGRGYEWQKEEQLWAHSQHGWVIEPSLHGKMDISNAYGSVWYGITRPTDVIQAMYLHTYVLKEIPF